MKRENSLASETEQAYSFERRWVRRSQGYNFERRFAINSRSVHPRPDGADQLPECPPFDERESGEDGNKSDCRERVDEFVEKHPTQECRRDGFEVADEVDLRGAEPREEFEVDEERRRAADDREIDERPDGGSGPLDSRERLVRHNTGEMEQRGSQEHRPRLKRPGGNVRRERPSQDGTEGETCGRDEHDADTDHVAGKERVRVRLGDEADPDESENEPDDSEPRDAVTEESRREQRGENRAETDDDSRDGTRDVLLSEIEKGVVAADQERASDTHERPVGSRVWTPVIGRDRGVSEDDETGEVVPKRGEVKRWEILQPDFDGDERTPPKRPEEEK
ncbi:hypothetical protein HFX_6283 (plasmid) [Haloferax mediterranei ATCC 33500]|uniref:Uncharacterized protein n=1 Tax=Haloferax mediterranei (strain ATCC 33500 / DSM 1411 / JCM 8866 / NBRC 14739 / NCIMB 2177 / R-4) TaxID=523841 RepID=I3RAZ5_HALMT|nr:hypothetical protein HFX_6283 [Haloferax mediterranei ATCC 33500]